MIQCPKCLEWYAVPQWPFCPHESVFSQAAQHFDPVVYHVNAEGTIRFPGAVDAPMPEGFERKELKTIGEVRAFQARINTAENAKIREQVEQECAWIEHVEATERPALRQRMASMSPAGRAFAEMAIAIHNAHRPRSGDAGFHIEPFEMDTSNREAYRDAVTRWQKHRR